MHRSQTQNQKTQGVEKKNSANDSVGEKVYPKAERTIEDERCKPKIAVSEILINTVTTEKRRSLLPSI